MTRGEGGPTVAELLDWARLFFEKGGLPEARANAEFLMASVLNTGRGQVTAIGSQRIDENRRRRYRGLILKRASRMPMAYILGTQNFMGLEIEVTPNVLVPRPETEELVGAAVGLAKSMRPQPGRGLQALDLGTGSGCIALALVSLVPDCFVVAIDSNRAALEVAARNARRLRLDQRVRFIQADLFKPALTAAASWADLIVSNPPYVPTGRIARLDPEVLHEPRAALDGGKDGLDAVRAIAASAPATLRSGGWLALEIDEGQGMRVRDILERRGFEAVEIRKDSNGLERIALGRCTGK